MTFDNCMNLPLQRFSFVMFTPSIFYEHVSPCAGRSSLCQVAPHLSSLGWTFMKVITTEDQAVPGMWHTRDIHLMCVLCYFKWSDNEPSLSRMFLIMKYTFRNISIKVSPCWPLSPKCERSQTGLLNEAGCPLKAAEFLCKCESGNYNQLNSPLQMFPPPKVFVLSSSETPHPHPACWYELLATSARLDESLIIFALIK